MDNLATIYETNKVIRDLREQIHFLMYNDAQRCLFMDSITLLKVSKLKRKYDVLKYQRDKKIQQTYSGTNVRPKTSVATYMPLIEMVVIPKLKISTMSIGKNETKMTMAPKWFKKDDSDEILRTIKYPTNVTNRHQFDTIARFRSTRKATNDFMKEPLQAAQQSTETLVLALDAFIQQFDGQLSFTSENLSFEDSAHRTACGVADLGSIHLLANEHISSANFNLVVDISYADLAKSSDTMENFILQFADAIAQDLSCNNDYVRVTSVQNSNQRKEKAMVNIVITTPNKEKTEEIANDFQNRAKMGFSKKNILGYIEPSAYECKWMPVLSFLQLQPLDFDSKHNFDYTQGNLPKVLRRGGLDYTLPIGWFRHALKVDNKYSDSIAWLGSANGPGEWPVAFHGTKSVAVKGIKDLGLLTSHIQRDRMLQDAITQKGEEVNRPGLYVATHCNGGSHPQYTSSFQVQKPNGENESFHVVFQCRVRPNSYTTHKKPVESGEAWRIVDPTAVRPYGILLKSTTIKVPFEQNDT